MQLRKPSDGHFVIVDTKIVNFQRRRLVKYCHLIIVNCDELQLRLIFLPVKVELFDLNIVYLTT